MYSGRKIPPVKNLHSRKKWGVKIWNDVSSSLLFAFMVCFSSCQRDMCVTPCCQQLWLITQLWYTITLQRCTDVNSQGKVNKSSVLDGCDKLNEISSRWLHLNCCLAYLRWSRGAGCEVITFHNEQWWKYVYPFMCWFWSMTKADEKKNRGTRLEQPVAVGGWALWYHYWNFK